MKTEALEWVCEKRWPGGCRGALGPARAHRPACEHLFVTASGSPYTLFRRSLEMGSLPLVRLHAAELSRIALGDALGVCLLFARAEPASFDRAATRWLGRLCCEAPIGLGDAQLAAAALHALGRGERRAPWP